MLCMYMYSIARTDLLLWVLSCLVVKSMRMATRQNMCESPKVVGKGVGGKYIYIHSFISVICAFVATKIFQSLTMHGQNDTKVIFVRYVYAWVLLVKLMHCCSGDLWGHTYTSCRSIGQPALLTLQLLNYFKRGSTVILNETLNCKQSPHIYVVGQ